jgi:nucleotidyltransferase substrate binding protein (TIGR01987 family)
MSLDFTSLEKALLSLKEILEQPVNKYIRAGTIQCFEYTFELSWKMMQRVLKEQGIVTGSPMQAFREAEKTKLISNLNFWIEMLKQRNLTVHTYNEDTAEEVYNSIIHFPKKVDELIIRLKEESK